MIKYDIIDIYIVLFYIFKKGEKMIKKTFSDKELIKLLENNLSFLSFSKDENGYLLGIDFDLDKLLNKLKSNKVDVIVLYIQKNLSFLKEYGYEVEEIIYIPHLSIPDIIYVSFLKSIKNNSDWGGNFICKKLI